MNEKAVHCGCPLESHIHTREGLAETAELDSLMSGTCIVFYVTYKTWLILYFRSCSIHIYSVLKRDIYYHTRPYSRKIAYN